MPTATTDHAAPRPPLALVAGALVVTCEWAGDRWRHHVAHRGRPVVESVEGTGPGGDPRWPASPALQEISSARAEGRPALLAVGAAGRSHFSASLTPDPRLADTVLVEVACRIVEPAAWLGSTYRGAAGDAVRIDAAGGDSAPATVRWSYRIGPTGVTPAAGDEPHPPRSA